MPESDADPETLEKKETNGNVCVPEPKTTETIRPGNLGDTAELKDFMKKSPDTVKSTVLVL